MAEHREKHVEVEPRDEAQQEPDVDPLIAATVAYLDEIRRDALAGDAVSPLKQYEMLQSRALLAAATAGSAEEWASAVARGLCVTRTMRGTNARLRDLVAAVQEQAKAQGVSVRRATSRWLNQVHREIGYIIALLMLAAERRRERYERNF